MAQPGNTAAQNRWIVAGLWLFLYASYALLSPPLLDSAESVRAEAARELVLRADPAVFTLLGVPYAETAPLLTWCTAAAIRFAGEGAAQVRLPGVLAVLLLAWLVEGFARRMFRSSRAGLYAAAILLLSGGVFACTRLCADALLPCLFATIAVLCFALAELARPGYKGGAPMLPMLGFGVACGLAVLAGGALQAFTVLLAALVYLYQVHGCRGALQRLRRLHPAPSLAAFLLIAAPWYVVHHVSPLREVLPPHPHAPWLAALLLLLLPWSAFLPATLQERRGSKLLSLLSTAALLPLLFSAVPFALGREYAGEMLLAVPFFAVLLGGWLHREADEAESMAVPAPLGRSGQSASAVLVGCAVAASLLCAALLLRPGSAALLRAGAPLSTTQTLTAVARSDPGSMVLIALVLPVGALLNLLLRRSFRPAAGNMVLAVTVLVVLSAFHALLNAVSPALSSQSLAAALATELRPGNTVVVNEDVGAAATLAFSLEREDIHLLLHAASAGWSPAHVETKETLQQRWPGPERVFLLTGPLDVPSLPGKVWIVAESGGRQLLSNKPAAY